MKLKFLILACLISYSAWAETNFSVSEFNVINLGDGRLFFRTQDDEKPLEGEQRIVDGYTTEYILAQFSEGLYDGKYEHYRHNKLIEKGTYKAGNKDGVFIKYYSSGQVESETPFTGGKINGTIISYYENGKLKSKRNFKSGINDGASLKWHPETEELIEELNYIDGKFHGKQVEYALGSKTIYQTVSYYENGVRNGDFLNTRNGQVIAKGKYKNGEKEGVWNEYNDDGTPKKITTYKDGKLNGESQLFYNGALEKIINYKGGKRDGVVKNFSYKTGNLETEYHYINDRKEGGYKVYYDDGTLREEGNYIAGELLDGVRMKYHTNGKPEQSVSYKSGKLNGEYKRFFEDGTAMEIGNYKDDKLEGVEQKFSSKTGKLTDEYNYLHGDRNGEYKTYYDDGTLREEGRYEKGNAVYRKEYYKNGNVKRVEERNSRGTMEIERYSEDGTKR